MILTVTCVTETDVYCIFFLQEIGGGGFDEPEVVAVHERRVRAARVRLRDERGGDAARQRAGLERELGRDATRLIRQDRLLPVRLQVRLIRATEFPIPSFVRFRHVLFLEFP